MTEQTPTNWPDPERPGVPMFPDRDMAHVLCTDPEGEGNLVYYWKAKHHVWVEYDHEGPEDALEGYDLIGWAYIGPVLTPAQIAEMLAGERERCAKVTTEVSDTYYIQREEAESDDERIYADERMCAAQECAEAIRNLGDAP